MPSIFTLYGAARKCHWKLTRVFHGEPETKGCFPTRQAADDFADMLNPLPCYGERCWTPVRATLSGPRRAFVRRSLGHPGLPRSQKDVFRIARKQGWEIDRTRKGHYKLCPPDPAQRCVIASGTPGDYRAVRNLITDLRRSGLKI